MPAVKKVHLPPDEIWEAIRLACKNWRKHSTKLGITDAQNGARLMMIIDDWIEDKLAEREFAFTAPIEPDDWAMFAGMLRAEAQAAGYTTDALEIACGGDVSSFIARKMAARALPAFGIPDSSNLGSAFLPG